MVENLQIAQKLGLVLIIPLVALIALTMVQVGRDLSARGEAAQNADHAEFAATVTGLTHQLQLERDLSLGYVAAPAAGRSGPLDEQRARTTAAVASYQAQLERIDITAGDPDLPGLVADAQELLDQLNAERELVDQTDDPRPAATRLYYSDTVRALLDAAAAGDAGERELLNDSTAFNLMSRVKENASQERGLVYAALAGNQLSVDDRQRLTSLISTQRSVTEQFIRAADRDQQRFFAAQTVNQNSQVNDGLRRVMLTPLQAGQRVGGVGFGSGEGIQQALEIMTTRSDNLRRVEARLGEAAAATSRANQDAATVRALTNGAVLVAALALAVAFSLMIARSMVRQLRRLAAAADQVAAKQLPTIVDRLQSGDVQLDEVTGRSTRLAVRSRDEIGQVAKAFDQVHQVALRVAGEQAALRHSIGQLFLNLARRSQVLIDRQLDLIDELEQQEADPDALAELFRLDHLATRMRRNAENLIVLSDAKPQRRWSEPVALLDVVRAALAEVEDYQRIDILIIDRIMVVGQTANDLAHLLAELLENATSFSSSASRVQVAGQVIGSGYLIEIEDRGIGMTDEQLAQTNDRLASPLAIDPALSRTLGFHVVGRLAVRHGIAAQLRHSWYGGITALVRLPASVLTEQDEQPISGLTRRGSGNPAKLVPLLNRDRGAPGGPQPDSQPQAPAALANSGLGSYLPLRHHLSGTDSGTDEIPRALVRSDQSTSHPELASPPPRSNGTRRLHAQPDQPDELGTGRFGAAEFPSTGEASGSQPRNGRAAGSPDVRDVRDRRRPGDQPGLRRGRQDTGESPPDRPDPPDGS